MLTPITPIKNLAAFLPQKDDVNADKPIGGVLVTPEKIVATDSYKLIERTGKTGVKKSVIVAMPPKIKTFDVITLDKSGKSALLFKGEASYRQTTTPADQYPKYEQVIPTAFPVFTICLSASHLKAICEAFEQDTGNFIISFWGKHQPVLFKAGDTRALLMPIQQPNG